METMHPGGRFPIRRWIRTLLVTLLTAGVFTLLPGVLAAPQGELQERPQITDRRDAAGEQCLVCGTPIDQGEVVEIRYKGRTFHVMADMLPRFSESPDEYFAKLQARSALFDERSAGVPMKSAWLWLGIYVLAGLIGAAACGYLAISKCLPPLPWFFAGLFGNIAGVVVVLLAPRGDASALPAGIPGGFSKVPRTRAPLPCPSCGAVNHPAASECSGCGNALQPVVEAETGRV